MSLVCIDSGATISEDEKYRYLLYRVVKMGFFGANLGTLLFIMLNPSTADASVNDPTIHRCISFARAWGYDRLEVVNLFAYRATDSRELLKAENPVGSKNDDFICRAADRAYLIVCAWGSMGNMEGRADDVRRMLRGLPLYTFGLTKNGQPRHPLYTAKETKLEVFK